jgi:rod shape-determining protein MreC
LIGHVVDAGESAARILLLNDPNSRIPVLAGPSAIRAILKGDGAAVPRLTNLASASTSAPAAAGLVAPVLRNGDDILTSGDEGLLPRGLKIGVVQLEDDGPRVLLAAKLRGLEFVSLLFFKPPVLKKAGESASADQPAPLLPPGQLARGKMVPSSGRRHPGTQGAPPGWPSQ